MEEENKEKFKKHWMQTLPRTREELQEEVRQIELQETDFKIVFLCECLKMLIHKYIAIWNVLLQNEELNREERLMLDVMNKIGEDYNKNNEI